MSKYNYTIEVYRMGYTQRMVYDPVSAAHKHTHVPTGTYQYYWGNYYNSSPALIRSIELWMNKPKYAVFVNGVCLQMGELPPLLIQELLNNMHHGKS